MVGKSSSATDESGRSAKAPSLKRTPFGIGEDAPPRPVPIPVLQTRPRPMPAHVARVSPPIPRQAGFGGSHSAQVIASYPPLPEQDIFGGSIESPTEVSTSSTSFASWRRGSQESAMGMTNSDGDSSSYFSLPPKPKLGDRTRSTAVRLSRQGFVSSASTTFAVRHIARGSEDWNVLIKPFVSDLVFRSLVCRRYQSEVSFRPYTCQAAVLFIDFSSYSKITAAIAHRGAHELSDIVNAYLSEILKIVNAFGGDVVKFAGDAVLIVWEGDEKDLALNVLCAAKCASEVQAGAGSYPVEGTSLQFRVHCGICCGTLESEIFEAPTHVNMQRLYHAVGGESLYEISELVDLAKAGEICISDACVEILGKIGCYRDLTEDTYLLGAKILTSLQIDRPRFDQMEEHIEASLSARVLRRSQKIEEDFIHPTVLRLLSHGGHSPTQISEMRNLFVLFIAMTSNGSSVNWLMEVQGLLDLSRCPIVQIIDDDKGVHIVAAVNLYETVPEASLFGLEACHKLVNKQVGCAIGAAMGPTFCGVTGSNNVACRWDITGPPAVRAARLMQYALENDLEVAVDESVFAVPAAASRLEIIDSSVELKGSKNPVSVYSMTGASVQSAFHLLGTEHGNVHNEVVHAIRSFVCDRSRSAVVVSGIPYSGKKIVCQRAAGKAGFAPFLHVSDQNYGLLQLARSMATWYKYSDIDDVRYLAASVITHMEQSRWSCAHDECIRLVNLAVQEGLRACFVVDRVQFLDEFSISLMRECLHHRRTVRVSGSGSTRFCSDGSSNRGSDIDEPSAGEETGSICFLCTHVALYNWKTATNVVEDITRSRKTLKVPVFEVLEADPNELRRMFRDLSDMDVEDRWLDAYAETSGFCAGYFIKRAAASRNISGQLWSEGKPGLAETSEKLVLSIPPGLVRTNRLIKVTQVSPEAAMRFHQIYDELPPLFQMMTKVLSVATSGGFFKIPQFVAWEVLNDLIAKGVEANTFAIVLDELVDMFLIKIEYEGEENVVCFRHPALGDIAFDVCTPIQVAAIRKALLERLQPIQSMNFRVPLVMARLLHDLKEDEGKKRELWCESFKLFQVESRLYSTRDVRKWKELIEDEIHAAGYNACVILGEDVCTECPPIACVPHELPLLKIYSAPVAFGPMGHSLSVITRNIFQEWGVFHGASKQKVDVLQAATASAADRYLKETAIVEKVLSDYGLACTAKNSEMEREMIIAFAKPSENTDCVKTKACKALNEFIPQIVESRLQRLEKLSAKLRTGETPSFIQAAASPIYKAYCYLKSHEEDCAQDTAQHALMILATMNWRPKRVPEYLPLVHYQTVANVRNKTLTRLSKTEALIFRHQQTVVDFECFLITTALLNKS